jgi:PAS domain S-box-containing protein/putative nucleotidyltransferase with HDIG domain
MSSPKILVVEDETIVAKDIQSTLEELGYNVPAVVYSGKEAIAKTGETSPDLILMDIMLKGDMDGITAADQIRDRFNIPVIYLTAYANEQILKRARLTSPFGYMLKPFERREIHAVIEMALQKSRMEALLKKEKDKAQKYLDVAGVMILVIDNDGTVSLINRRGSEILGYDEAEIIGKNWFENFLPEADKRRKEEIHKKIMARETDPIKYDESSVATKGGEERIIAWYYTVLAEQDDMIGIIGSGEDITEKKRSEEKLKESYEKLSDALAGTVQALTSVVEMRDPYTSGHQKRVAQLASAIARQMELPEEQIEGIQMAALVHDIGKIGVPAEILIKPGKLSDNEFNMIKIHPQVGYEALKDVEFPWPVADTVLQHHERINGSGYPQGISGDDIILDAKILSVSDVVEAIASHRPYRPALGIEVALKEISQNRNVLYDAEVADACLTLFKEKEFSFE